MSFVIESAGVDALHVEFTAAPSAALTAQLCQMAAQLEQQFKAILLDITIGWDSLLIQYDMQRVGYSELYDRLMQWCTQWLEQSTGVELAAVNASGELALPVLYDGEDLEEVARHCGLASAADVIALHSSSAFYVGAIGFAPGFAYLGGLDERLTLPRRSSPRARVPAGSVAIAAGQSALYPQASPGGWHLLGRCPLALFDPAAQPMSPFHVGRQVRCYPIDEAEFQALQGRLTV